MPDPIGIPERSAGVRSWAISFAVALAVGALAAFVFGGGPGAALPFAAGAVLFAAGMSATPPVANASIGANRVIRGLLGGAGFGALVLGLGNPPGEALIAGLGAAAVSAVLNGRWGRPPAATR